MSRPSSPDWLSARPWLSTLPICDGLLPWTGPFLPPGADLLAQLARFRDAGIDHVSLTAAAGNDDLPSALARVGYFRRVLAPARDWLVVAQDAAQIRQARADGCFSVSFHFQTATPFCADLDLVDAFRAAGIGRAILAYNEANPYADGCHESRNAGLSASGHRLLARMDAAGMLVDLSHCGVLTSLQALDAPLARAPIFSHSNARACFDHERNLTDEQIRACGRRGGYIGISGVGMFLGAGSADIARAMAQNAAHIANLIGAAHVGLGLDFMYLEGSDYGFFHAAADRWPRGYPAPPWDFLQPEPGCR